MIKQYLEFDCNWIGITNRDGSCQKCLCSTFFPEHNAAQIKERMEALLLAYEIATGGVR